MKANELRLGNYVLKSLKSGNGRKIEVKIDLGDFIRICDGSEIYNFEPIPLTEEWLLKLGFEKKKDNYNRYYFSIDGMDIKIDSDEFATEVGECLYKTIKYVHQLQNLYFALNDEELTIM